MAEAEALCRQILAAQPNHTDALHLIAFIAYQVGRHDLAVQWIRQVIAFEPNNAVAHSNLGESFRMMGRLDDAVSSFRRALRINPAYPDAWYNLGNALRDQGSLDEAIAAYHRALQFKPDFSQAHNNLGNALKGLRRFDEAIAAYRQALRISPDLPQIYANLGSVLCSRGQFDEAIAACCRALELKPDFAEAHKNLGDTLRGQGRLDDAIAAYRRALEIKSDYAEAQNNLGNALNEGGRLDEAIGAYRRAVDLKPNYAEGHNNLGVALSGRGELDESITSFRHALRLTPEDARIHSNLIYALNFHPGYDGGAIAGECARWEQEHAARLQSSVRPHGNDRDRARRLKIGYVSPNYFAQAESNFVVPLFEAHDHSMYEVHAFSDVQLPDAITERLKKCADIWHDTRALSDEELAGRIRDEDIDVLVDLSMHMGRNRLLVFAREPAPVQVAWLAYPGSTGLRSIGYRITDAKMEPSGEKPVWSAEEPVRMPDCWCCYDPTGSFPEINPLPALSSNGVTFGSLNNFTKVNDSLLALWARVLDSVKGSRLLLLCPEESARERVLGFFGARGIAAQRVEFVGRLPRWEYLSLYLGIDIGLDPLPYNGITTTCDALWMGVPVLTLPGEMPASRAGLSLLSTVGLGELAASSEDDYVRVAVELAGDLPRLAEFRATLRPRMLVSPLMNAPRFARNVEAAYRFMWDRWCSAGD